MNISNRSIYPIAMLVSLPLLILGGCASTDPVRLTPDTDLAVNEDRQMQNEVYVDPQEIEKAIDIIPEQELIEPFEVSAEEAPEAIAEIKKEEVNETPMPEEGIIRFAFDESVIDAQYGELLWQHAQYLKEHKNLILNINGHTDSSGARVYNEMLSKKRATQVANILVDFGVPAERIKVTGYASDQPLVGAISHKQHRRVELDFQDQQLVSN
jgi:outer membrane protein OmpA-like peptidoglycan-associated protein